MIEASPVDLFRLRMLHNCAWSCDRRLQDGLHPEHFCEDKSILSDFSFEVDKRKRCPERIKC